MEKQVLSGNRPSRRPGHSPVGRILLSASGGAAAVRTEVSPRRNHPIFRPKQVLVAATILILMASAFVLSGSGGIGLFSSKMKSLILHEDPQITGVLTAYSLPSFDAGAFEEGAQEIDSSLLQSLKMESHTVGSGETLSEIATERGLRIDTLISINSIRDVRRLSEGMKLKIPNIDGVFHTIRSGQTLSGIASSYGTDLNRILDINNLSSSVIKPGQQLFIPGARMNSFDLKKALGKLFVYPVTGRFTSAYGMRNDPFTGVRHFHNGIDIANKVGTPVRASLSGRVVKIDYDGIYGRYIILAHPEGYQTWYAHLNSVAVSRNQYVEQGQSIATVGNTGYSTGPHLHFSIFQRGQPKNPMDFLQ